MVRGTVRLRAAAIGCPDEASAVPATGRGAGLEHLHIHGRQHRTGSWVAPRPPPLYARRASQRAPAALAALPMAVVAVLLQRRLARGRWRDWWWSSQP